jgi:hypothetical protein
MKIKELKVRFAEILEDLDYKYEETVTKPTTPRVGTSKFSNLKKLRNSIYLLETTELFKIEVEALKNSGLFTTTKDEFSLSIQEGRPIRAKLDILISMVKSLNKAFSEITTTSSENSISIKLPEIKDFDDLSKTANIFNQIFTQSIINEEINGEVSIESFETGSVWIDVYLGSVTAITLIGSLAWSAAVVFKKIQEGRIIEEHVRSLKIKNESLKEIKEAQKKAIDLMIDAEARQLYSENFTSDKNNEQIERLKHSLRLLAEQIEKGAEIHPALNAPETVSQLFPDMKKLDLIESKIKKLKE